MQVNPPALILQKCRMRVRARAVTTQFSHDGLGLPVGDGTISIVAPLSRGSDNGTS